MKIENVHMSAIDGWRRLTGTLVWEVAKRKPYELYFEVPESQADHLLPASRKRKYRGQACLILLQPKLSVNQHRNRAYKVRNTS